MRPGGEAVATVGAGRFLLEVGSAAGTRAFFRPDQRGDPREIRVALAQPYPPGAAPAAGAEAATQELEAASRGSDRARELFLALAQGRVADLSYVDRDVDALRGTLERLDRQGQPGESLRLARALAPLLALAYRWVELVEALRIALRSARALGDAHGIAWARHELGTLTLVAEDLPAAESQLVEALRLREELGDGRGVEATRHNLGVLRRAYGAGEGRGGPRPLLIAALVAAVLLLAALGALLAMVVLDEDEEPAAVDTVAPAVEILEGPENPTEETSATFLFEADEDVRTFECRLDDGPFEECVSPQNYPGPLSVGRHVFAVRAIDFADNRSGAATFDWTIEQGEGPPVTITEAPPALTNQTTARFALQAPGAIRFECRVDDGDFQECPNIVVFEDLSEGEHTFVVRAFDADDDRGPPARHTWTIDTTPPAVDLGDLGFPEDTTNVRVPFTVDEAGSTVVCVLFTVDDPDAPEEEQEREEVARDDDCESPFVYRELAAETSYVVSLTATDPAGNTSEPEEEAFDSPVEP
ncbi:MAG TPA: hypothetical protein VD704_14240 [Gaiellaceae bacterium]|nr:hypothetical protein [Gaiellaceae bacterium]